ncbi:hypothetical protein DVH24_031963 [Malus domestica]|uniref:Uncharacterized protein n=1 Tax=Malus domestica TaxID=3750 RepID=A0A498J356_MALDO|nr:hypothetical protein DVH24_031963 [Malus domestica]
MFHYLYNNTWYTTRERVGCAAEIVKRDTLVIGLWQACSPSVIDLRSAGSVGLWEKVLGLMEV